MRSHRLWLGVLILGLLKLPAVYAQPSHRMLGDACAGCHGTRGHSSSPMPIIAGLPYAYLRQTMQDYKTGKRPSTIMGRVARGYDDAEIDALAAFFASQVWISPQQELDPKRVKNGSRLHRDGCSSCHKDNGRFQEDTLPRLAGQWNDYLEIVLEEYWLSERMMPHLFMSIAISQLDEDDLKALASFYASQR
ncbi:MAG: c-type cytochrome [Gammaproteobacteria bacterium]